MSSLKAKIAGTNKLRGNINTGDTYTGRDGFSPVIEVEEKEEGSKIIITDIEGTTEVLVKHGKTGKAFAYDDFTEEQLALLKGKDGANGKDGLNGKDGQDGYTPRKGIDYFTDQDKQELVQSVLSQVINGNEVTY